MTYLSGGKGHFRQTHCKGTDSGKDLPFPEVERGSNGWSTGRCGTVKEKAAWKVEKRLKGLKCHAKQSAFIFDFV